MLPTSLIQLKRDIETLDSRDKNAQAIQKKWQDQQEALRKLQDALTTERTTYNGWGEPIRTRATPLKPKAFVKLFQQTMKDIGAA